MFYCSQSLQNVTFNTVDEFLKLLLVSSNVGANISPLHRPLTSTSPGGQSFGPTSGATETRDEYTSKSDAAKFRCRFEDNIKCFM